MSVCVCVFKAHSWKLLPASCLYGLPAGCQCLLYSTTCTLTSQNRRQSSSKERFSIIQWNSHLSPSSLPLAFGSIMDESSLLVDGTVDGDNMTVADNSTMSWASDWLGYIALCMFSMVLLIPTLGIVGLMVWEYFSDESERKAERQKEIDMAVWLINWLIIYLS